MIKLRNVVLWSAMLVAWTTSVANAAILELNFADDGAIVWDGAGDVVTMNNVGEGETVLFSSVGLDPSTWVMDVTLDPGVLSPFDDTVVPLTVLKLGVIVSVEDPAACIGCQSLSAALGVHGFREPGEYRGFPPPGKFSDEVDLDTPVVALVALFAGLPITADSPEAFKLFLPVPEQQTLLALLNDYDPDALRIGLAADTDARGSVFWNARFELSAASVPEPTSLVLLGAGITCALAVRRRKRDAFQN